VSGRRTFVIVGAGLAGAKAAETLREEGFDGRIVLAGAEAERPYEHPPLSKDHPRGETHEKPYVHDEAFYAEGEIELRTSTRAENIDVAASELALHGASASASTACSWPAGAVAGQGRRRTAPPRRIEHCRSGHGNLLERTADTRAAV
jgi:3-phenylpropionate/trans-cinnamate dioxygenase ferredoxin reductase component